MADHNKPTVTSLYANFVAELDARLDDLALMLDPARTAASNIPTGAIRWDSASSKWQVWSGTAWGNLAATYAINALTASSAAKWTTARTLALSGDVTGSTTIDGSANKTITATLSNTGVTAGTYKSVTVDAKGRVTGATNPTTLAGYGITNAVPSADVAQVPAASKIVKATADGPIDLGWLDTAVARELRMLAVGVNPSLDLNFAKQEYKHYDGAEGLVSHPLTPFVTFTRPTTASYMGADGLLKTAAINEPRIEYDPITGECKGLLIEESRTNLLKYSDVSTGWNIVRASNVQNAAGSPDGTNTATLIKDNADNNSHYAFQLFSKEATPTTYVLSVYAKMKELRYIRLTSQSSSYQDSKHAHFDLLSGVRLGTNADSSMEVIGDGWYRCSLIFTTNAETSQRAEIYVTKSEASINYTGDGTSGLYIWGAQLEVGSFPTSYIKTEASAVTRGADNASVTGANFSSWYRQDEGSVFIDYALGRKLGASRSFVIHNATNNAFIDGVSGTGSDPLSGNGGTISAYNAGVHTTDFSSRVNSVGARYRLILSIKENDYAFSRNGEATLTDNNSPVPQALVRLAIGNNAAGSACINGHISRLTYWPKRLTNTQLQELSK